MPSYLSCERIPALQDERFSPDQLARRVLRTTILATVVTLTVNGVAYSDAVKDLRVTTPIIFSLWSSGVICLLGIVGWYFKSAASLVLLTLFSPMAGAVSLPLSYLVPFMHLSLCLTTPWALENCDKLPCMNSNKETWTFVNECTSEQLAMVGCPMLPGKDCQPRGSARHR